MNADARIAYLLALTEKVIQTRKTIDIKLSQSLQKVRISNVMQKLNVKGRSQAVVELVRLGELKI
jgi:LuxR family transcriptional regulator of spore coat protein